MYLLATLEAVLTFFVWVLLVMKSLKITMHSAQMYIFFSIYVSTLIPYNENKLIPLLKFI